MNKSTKDDSKKELQKKVDSCTKTLEEARYALKEAKRKKVGVKEAKLDLALAQEELLQATSEKLNISPHLAYLPVVIVILVVGAIFYPSAPTMNDLATKYINARKDVTCFKQSQSDPLVGEQKVFEDGVYQCRYEVLTEWNNQYGGHSYQRFIYDIEFKNNTPVRKTLLRDFIRDYGEDNIQIYSTP